MNNNLLKKYIDEVKGSHLIYICCFFAAVIIRFFASHNLPVNSYEASILLNITDNLPSYPEGISLIQSSLIKISFFIFGESDLAARIWSIIFGSLLVFSPLYLTDRISSKSAIVLSILITIDPFMIANSIHIGSNIFAVFACANMIGSIWKKRNFAAIIFSLILLSSGRGLFFSMALCAALFALNYDFNEKIKREFFRWIKVIKKKIQNSRYLNIGVFGIALLFYIALFKMDLSVIMSDLLHIFGSYFGGQVQISSLFLYQLILFSYFPLLAFSTIMVLITYWKTNKSLIRLILIWISIVFISLSINHYFKSFDLIWISYPLSIFTAVFVQELIDNFRINKKIDNLGLLVMGICFISLSLNIVSLIYQGVSGFSQYSTFISMVSTIIVIISLGIFFTLQFGIKQFVYVSKNTFFVIFFIIQIGISFRASGLAGSPYSELLWAGNIADTNQLQKQIVVKKQTKEFSNNDLNIDLLNYNEYGILWNLRSFNVEQFRGSAFPKEKVDILITKTEISEVMPYRYYGRKIIENAYPSWTNEPLKNIFYSDYWSWMTTRRSKMDKSFYYMY
ncbi:MAG: hypothetical protein MUP85_12480, partial [Candidatus Lokiarchaeota archaeon]|nr:hypothetical protein [Candidatus Lokiarchaeota archaeon]